MREDAVRRLGRQLAQAIEQKDVQIVGGLVCVLTSLWPMEAERELREAFDRDLVDLGLIDREFVEASIENGESGMREELANCPPTGIDDTIEELRTWASFQERPAKPSRPRPTWTPPPRTRGRRGSFGVARRGAAATASAGTSPALAAAAKNSRSAAAAGIDGIVGDSPLLRGGPLLPVAPRSNGCDRATLARASTDPY